jgi:NAD-dependent deacetylase
VSVSKSQNGLIQQAASLIKNAKYTIAFTGAGISVESGIPPFRGENGLWNKYDASLLELDNFQQHPKESWQLLVKLFYHHFEKAQPNAAHYALAEMEKNHFLKTVITQNIDNLHQEAGSKHVLEFHGNTRRQICLSCGDIIDTDEINLNSLPPHCEICGGLLKPDITFFGEAIQEPANTYAFREAGRCDLILIIGSTGEVYPAAFIPEVAKEAGANVIEINIELSNYTIQLTDLFIQGKAGEVMQKLTEFLEISTSHSQT